MRRVSRIRILSRWREYVKLIAEAVKVVEPQAKLYLVGGAAEGRLTVLSDIDVLLVLPRRPGFEEAAELRARVLEEAERLGLPLYVPVELHIIGEGDLRKYLTRGKVVPVP